MTAPASLPLAGDLDIGRVLQRGFSAMRVNIAPVLITGAVLPGAVTAIYGMLRVTGVLAPVDENFASAFTGAPGENIAIGLTSLFYSGGLIQAALASFEGRGTSVADMLEAGRRHFPKFFGIGFITNFVVIVGLLLLIVPGVIFWLKWMVARPAHVAEQLSIAESLERSSKLTQGQRLRLLGVAVATGLMVAVAIVAIGLAFGGIGFLVGGEAPFEVIGAPLIQILIPAVFSFMAASAYADLRLVKEGRGAGSIAEVFA